MTSLHRLRFRNTLKPRTPVPVRPTRWCRGVVDVPNPDGSVAVFLAGDTVAVDCYCYDQFSPPLTHGDLVDVRREDGWAVICGRFAAAPLNPPGT